MTSTEVTRDWLLWSLSIVYLFGFTSLFVQAPGLIGEHGIAPAVRLLEEEAESVEEFLTNRPTLLRLLPKIGLDADLGIDFLCVAGVIVSFVAAISKDHRNALVAALQWIFYLSIAQVGHIFLSSKWDSLLLETGFIAIFLAPLGLFGLHDWKVSPQDESENHRLPQWLMRWILFRVVLGEGLTGMVNIFGLNYHQETTDANLQNLLQLHEHQILPTPVAWLINLLPTPVVAIGCGLCVLSSVLGSILILLPSKRLRRFVFYWQCLSVICGIILSNQGFYPLLIISISLSLLNDDFFKKFQSPWKKQMASNGTISSSHADGQENGYSGVKVRVEIKRESIFYKYNVKRYIVASFIILCALACYGYPVLHSHDNFLVELMVSAMHSVYGSVGFILLLAIILGATSISFECVHIFKKLWHNKGLTRAKKAFNAARFLCLGVITLTIFLISLVPLTWVNNQESGNFLPNGLQETYLWTHKHYKLVNNYITLSKRVEMNGNPVGRLELILEGSRNLESEEWTEYSFRFKPGHPNTSPSIIAPHNPRLDESLWFAAQSNYKQHHWVLNLVYRLLNNQEEVLELLGENPFPDEPPDYIKASIYEYHFAYNNGSEEGSSSDWFTRKWISHYLPTLSKSDPSFIKYLKLSGLIRISDSKRSQPMHLCRETNILGTFLGFLRSLLGQSNGSCLCVVLLFLGLILSLVDPSRKQRVSSHFQSHTDFDGEVYSSTGKGQMHCHYSASKTKSRHPLG